MEKRELTCIGCPLGCSITVTLENGEIRGNVVLEIAGIMSDCPLTEMNKKLEGAKKAAKQAEAPQDEQK